MTDAERAKRDELQLIAAREIASLIGCVVVVLLLMPGVEVWAQHQVWRLRERFTRRARAEDEAVAELRRAISKWEHEQQAAP
jgi:cytoskeletal protein RodZ